MLSTNVKTTGDLMSIALEAEREAIRRYSELAGKMRQGNNESAAALFERMVLEEQEHERLLLEWMAQEKIDANPDIGPISWRDPNISTTYDNEARDPYHSTPYRALAFAVHNEEIAFRFYTHVAAESENETVRQYAEVLAREELGHAALLRAERRKAYHAERSAGIVEPSLDPKAIQNEIDLLTAAIHIDSHMVREMDMFIANSAEIDSLAKETRDQINKNETILNGKSSPSENILKNLERIDSYNSYMEKNADDPDSRLQRLFACCDRSFAFYDSIVETTTDEAIMLTAQKLTSSALDRIDVFKKVFGNSYLPDN
jgi:rubrerythrin